MKNMKQERQGADGKLPPIAPLANPYVPFQTVDPPKYEAGYGLIRGTMYPGLDLPFQGKVNTKELNRTPLTELQALGFAIQDLALYLDTHRDDRGALEAYHAYQTMYKECREKYMRQYGAMNHMHPDGSAEYRWLDDPWPWEFCKNKEV